MERCPFPSSTSFRDTWLCRRVAQLLVCLMVLQTLPFQLLSQTHQWNPSLILPKLERLVSSFSIGPASAEAGILPTLDVDDNGQADALTDGMLILRFLFGFKGAGLTNGVLALDAQRTDPAAILAYLEPLRDTMLDADCNGQADAFTDGMLIARFLMGFTGASLINGVHDPAGCRNSPEDIIAFLTVFLPGLNVPPDAHAGPSQTVPVNTLVQLDGHRSLDRNGDVLNYAWTFVQQPPGSTATLLNPTTFTPSFIADVAGEYGAQLIVNDGQVDSLPVTVTISTTNVAPVANAGHDRQVQVGETIQLNGSHSSDADGNALTFSWTLRSQPAGSGATLSDAQAIFPTLTVDVAGSYIVELLVNDGIEPSAPSTVTLSTTNLIPVAQAGPDQVVAVGQDVTLDGHRSYDPNGDLLTFQWAILSAPLVSTAIVDVPTSVKPTFNTDIEGTYILQLLVSDGTGDCRPDTVIVTTSNVSPVANAGIDRLVQAGETLELTGEGSTDLNGDMLMFEWALLTKPVNSTATLSNPTGLQPTLDIDVNGTYLAQVIVQDGQGGQDIDTVVLTNTNVAPTAQAGSDQTVVTGQTAFLDSTVSTDANGDSLTHQWNMVAKPQNSTTTVQDSDTSLPSFDIDQEGNYVADVTVKDPQGAQDRDAVVVHTQNSRPVADAGPDQDGVAIGQNIILDGSNSNDADNDLLNFEWALTVKPETSSATLNNPSTANPDFVPDVVGTYLGQVVVEDAAQQSEPDTVVITTGGNSAPTANAGQDQTPTVGDTVQLAGNASGDVQNDPLTFAWSLNTRPLGSFASIVDPTSATPTLFVDLIGNYEVGLIVNDGEFDSQVDIMMITSTRPLATINAINPDTASIGDLISISGTNLAPLAGTSPTIALAKQGGGTIDAPLTMTEDTTIQLTVPPGTASGTLSLMVDGQEIASTDELMIVASSSFEMIVEPPTADVLEGESISYMVKLSSTTGFTQLATLSVTGLPAGLTATFVPEQISADQESLLTISAPVGQPMDSSMLTVNAEATVDGFDLMEAVDVTLNTQAITTSFLGRTVISNAAETPLAGVTVTMLGLDGSGNATGCSGQGISDAAGNFALTGLSANCQNNQLVRYDGSTATNPPGNYASVDKRYELTEDQVTKPPVLVHLPSLDNVDRKMIPQNAASDETYLFPGIPNLSITVYAGTVFTLEDGSQPNPFPLEAVEIALDRLPGGNLPESEDGLVPFLVGFQPANTSVNQPVAITYPNSFAIAPNTPVELLTLDPTQGIMVTYGTGVISSDGLQVVPDVNPATPGKRFGLTHLGWHAPRVPRNENTNAGAQNKTQSAGLAGQTCPMAVGGAISLSSGIEIRTETDMAFGGQRGQIAITRHYQSDTTAVGPFGIGTYHNYSHRLNSNAPSTTDTLTLTMPDGNQIPFAQRQDGTFTNETIPAFQGTVITVVNGNDTQVKVKDCSTYDFVPSGTDQGSVLKSITDPNGNQITLHRNSPNMNRIDEVEDPVERKLILEYDDDDRIIKVTDPIQRTVEYTYNSQGTLETVTNPEGGVMRYGYDAENRLNHITDPRGVVIAQLTYGVNGRVEQEVQADGGVLQFTYTFLNPQVETSPVLTTEFTDPLGHTTIYRYNTQGILTQVTDALGQTTIFEREPGTNLLLSRTGTATCAVCGNTRLGDSTNTFDANGNLLTVTDTLDQKATMTYDAVVNKVTSLTDPLDHVVELNYDEKGNVLTSTDQNGKITTLTYDDSGLVTKIKDPLDEETLLTYDDNGNLETVTDANGDVTTFEYDAISRLIASIDAKNRKTEITHDTLNRVVKTQDPLGLETIFAYDEVGNLLSLKDAKGQETIFTYDGMNRRDTRTDPLGRPETFAYDEAGNLLEATDRRGQISRFTYDALNRLMTASYDDGSIVELTYDQRGRVVEVNDSAGGIFTFAHDALGRITNQTTPKGQVEYTFDPLGRVLTRTVVGQPMLTHTYDPAGNLLSAELPQASSTFTYDDRNALTKIERSNGVTTDYAYDPVGRLLELVHAKGQAIVDRITYGNDKVGNRLSQMTSLGQALITQPTASTFDSNNRLLTRGATTYAYDENGNRVSATDTAGTKTYTWDSRNRLTKLETPIKTIEFQYDFAGNMIQQTTTDSNGTVTQNYLLDDLTNVAHESRSDGTQLTMLSGGTIDSHLAVSSPNGQTDFGLTNGLNSTVAIVNEAGMPTGSLNYEPYGETTTGSTYPFQYTGRVTVASNLYYYRARFYDPTTGGFISEDPILFNGGSTNLYQYVLSNPLNLVDPAGNVAITATTVLLSAAGVGAAVGAISGFTNSNSNTVAGIIVDVIFGAGTGALGGGIAGIAAGSAILTSGASLGLLGHLGVIGGSIVAGAGPPAIGFSVPSGDKLVQNAVNSILSLGNKLINLLKPSCSPKRFNGDGSSGRRG